MKPIVFALVALLAVITIALGFASRRSTTERSQSFDEGQAVLDAVAAVDYYLPLLIEDSKLATVFVPPDGFPVTPSKDPVTRLHQLDEEKERQANHAEESERMSREMYAQLAKLAGQKFNGLSGGRYASPPWNIQGHHYVSTDRNALFDNSTLSLRIHVMHPRAYRTRVDTGLEIRNDPDKSGVTNVGNLKISPFGGDWTIMVSHPGVDHGMTGTESKSQTVPSAAIKNELADLIAKGPITNKQSGHQYCLLMPVRKNGAPLQWSDAHRVAKELGGYLVAINDQEEQKWIEDRFLREKNLWIGLSDFDGDGRYSWVNGETSTYQNWALGEPNGRNEKFVHLWSEKFRPDQGGMWNDAYDMFFEVQGLVEFEPDWSLPAK